MHHVWKTPAFTTASVPEREGEDGGRVVEPAKPLLLEEVDEGFGVGGPPEANPPAFQAAAFFPVSVELSVIGDPAAPVGRRHGLDACFGEIDKLCKHLHLPVQSGSDPILKAMNRGYGRAHYLGLVEKLRAACPDIRLTTDIIVGFPGEQEQDFADTMTLLEEVRYAEIYSFLFSSRRGTAAAGLPDDTPAKAKQERFDRMLDLHRAIAEEPLVGNPDDVVLLPERRAVRHASR